MKSIKIRLDVNNYFEHVIKILRAVPPFDQLRDRELEVYSRLLFHFSRIKAQNSEMDFISLNKILFSYETRRLIEEELNLSDANLRNKISQLKTKQIIDQKTLIQRYIILYGEDIEYKFITI